MPETFETWATMAGYGAAPPGQTLDPLELGDRYGYLGFIAAGGMGEVHRVYDFKMERPVAVKLIKTRDSTRLERFFLEIQVTANLQHPTIPPVYDWGILDDGRLWFTMQEVVGLGLDEIIRALHMARTDRMWNAAHDGWSLKRLMGVYLRISQSIAFAHTKGVVHRDLKPPNVMVGSLGQVYVMDWGMAKLRGVLERQGGEGIVPGDMTQVGAVLGTPAYMAPEQAMGDAEAHTAASDVYAFGALLYYALAGVPQFEGTARAIVDQLRDGPPQLLRLRVSPDHPPMPEDLVQVVNKSMARDPDDRPSAEWISQELEAWLDGARRRARAVELVQEAVTLAWSRRQLVARANLMRVEAEASLEGLPAHAPIAEKRAGWQLQDGAQALEAEAELMLDNRLHVLRTALNYDPELVQAHRALAEHYADALREAELQGDTTAAERAERRLEDHDRGQYAGLLKGLSAVTLRPAAPCRVHVYRYELRERALRAELVESHDVDEALRLEVRHGSYLLEFRASGRATVRLPLLLRRGGDDPRVHPVSGEPVVVPLPRSGLLGPDDVVVPAGWSVFGGDPEAADPWPATRLWVDHVILRRFQVTWDEYIAFLNRELDAGRPVSELVPWFKTTGWKLEPVDGRFELGHSDDAPAHVGRHPVRGLRRLTAEAYALAERARTGKAWRLPSSWEWERGARGADARHFPWGNFPEPTWAGGLRSTGRKPMTVDVDAMPMDESPCGVRGTASSVRELCQDPWRKEMPKAGMAPVGPWSLDAAYYWCMGGAFVNRVDRNHLANRLVSERDGGPMAGLRLARSLTGPELG